jgi:hypothetical protein
MGKVLFSISIRVLGSAVIDSFVAAQFTSSSVSASVCVFVVIGFGLRLTTLSAGLILGNSGLLFSLLTPLDVSASQGS